MFAFTIMKTWSGNISKKWDQGNEGDVGNIPSNYSGRELKVGGENLALESTMALTDCIMFSMQSFNSVSSSKGLSLDFLF